MNKQQMRIYIFYSIKFNYAYDNKKSGDIMRVENRKIEGDIKINEEVTMNGTINGSAIVLKGGLLVLNGIVNQDLILESDSKAQVFGSVNGNIYNKGGELEIHGTIMGTIHKEAGIIVIYPESNIKGKIY